MTINLSGITITGGVTFTQPPGTDVTPSISLSDWSSKNSSTITEPTTGTFRFVRDASSSDGDVGLLELSGLSGSTQYRLDFEYKMDSGSTDFTVEVSRHSDGRQFKGDAQTTSTSFTSGSITWSQGSYITNAWVTPVVGAQGGAGEIRNITLREL